MDIIRHEHIKWDPKRDWKQNLKRSIEWRESQVMQYVHIEQPIQTIIDEQINHVTV